MRESHPSGLHWQGVLLLAVLLAAIGGPAMATVCSLLEACPMGVSPEPCHGDAEPVDEAMDCCPDGKTPIQVRPAPTLQLELAPDRGFGPRLEAPRSEYEPVRAPERCSRSPGRTRALLSSFLL